MLTIESGKNVKPTAEGILSSLCSIIRCAADANLDKRCHTFAKSSISDVTRENAYLLFYFKNYGTEQIGHRMKTGTALNRISYA